MERIVLRRFDPNRDYPFFYRVYSDYNEQHNLFDLVNLNSAERFPKVFEKALSHNYKDTFIIEESGSGQYVGFIISYGYSPNDGHIKMMEYVEENYRRCGYAGLACLKFLQMLFKHYALRKIYTEVYAFNVESIRAHIGAGFQEEARLKDYRFYDGKYWDFITYSISRETFCRDLAELVERMDAVVGGEWNENLPSDH